MDIFGEVVEVVDEVQIRTGKVGNMSGLYFYVEVLQMRGWDIVDYFDRVFRGKGGKQEGLDGGDELSRDRLVRLILDGEEQLEGYKVERFGEESEEVEDELLGLREEVEVIVEGNNILLDKSGKNTVNIGLLSNNQLA